MAKALSCASGYQFVQNRTMREWKRLYKIDESQIFSFENQFLLISSSFIKRIKSEFRSSDFISNGAAFTEVLCLKSNMNENRIELRKPEEKTILKSLLNIAGRYAALHYDMVIHVRNTDSPEFDELSFRFYEKYGIAYKIYDRGCNTTDIIESIIREVDIPKLQSVESAIYETEQLVNFNIWKS